MNSSEAKNINFIEFIARLCNREQIVSIQENKALFKHPIKNEKKASLSVFINRENKTWWYKDFSNSDNGNIIDFVMKNYNINDVSSALKKICEIMNITQENKYIPVEFENTKISENNIKIKSIKELNNQALIDYLIERKINISTAKKYLKEVYYSIKKENGVKYFFGIGFENKSNGFEIRNKYIKSNIIKKDITIIEAKNKISDGVLIFEGFSNFLSALTYYDITNCKYDVIILNSVSLLNKATEYIITKKYKKIFDYLDNDFAGQETQCKLIKDLENAFKRKEIDFIPKIINSFKIYQSFNDFNDFLKSI
ncbi:toprim domain-containing protein (plasmid) [Aliarcobacter butzleri]|uniref:toprim domain-containing protein n=1 Tax=Aliarcobacter butzleri TaxID=28197 RepID=UPI003B28D8C1